MGRSPSLQMTVRPLHKIIEQDVNTQACQEQAATDITGQASISGLREAVEDVNGARDVQEQGRVEIGPSDILIASLSGEVDMHKDRHERDAKESSKVHLNSCGTIQHAAVTRLIARNSHEALCPGPPR